LYWESATHVVIMFVRPYLYIVMEAFSAVDKLTLTMGVDHRVDRGTCPLLFEVGGRNVFCPPYFLGEQILCVCT